MQSTLEQAKATPVPESAREHRRSYPGLWLILIFVIYPFSFGPAYKLSQVCPAIKPALVVYAPLALLIQKSETAGEITVWYLYNVWDVDISR